MVADIWSQNVQIPDMTVDRATNMRSNKDLSLLSLAQYPRVRVNIIGGGGGD